MANEFVESLKNHMQKSVDSFQHEISVIRTGRANASMLDLVKVEYYGFPTPLNEIAQIMIPEPRQLMIKPYERESLSLIEKNPLWSVVTVRFLTLTLFRFPKLSFNRF